MTIITIEQWECDICRLRPTHTNGHPVDGMPTSEWVIFAIKDHLNTVQYNYKHACPSCVKAVMKEAPAVTYDD